MAGLSQTAGRILTRSVSKFLDPDPGHGIPDLEQLRLAEFGNRTELAIRFVVVTAGSFALLLVTGHWLGPIWGIAYIATQVLTYLALRRAAPPYHMGDYIWGAGGYLISSMIFLTMPIGLFIFGDPIMAFCGGIGLMSLAVFTLWREEPPAIMLPYDLTLAWVTAALILWAVLPRAEHPVMFVMAIVLTVTALCYYSLALIATFRARQSLKAAARRGIEAQRMEAVGRLSGGIAHDFNNILTALQGNLELYEEVQDPEERAQLVQEARSASRRAAGLVQQLLTLAKRAPMPPSQVDVATIIQELTTLAARLMPANVTVYPALPVTTLSVQADQVKLLSALLNLILNARDALPNGGEITLAASPVVVGVASDQLPLEAGRYVKFTVSDTGHGMLPEVAARALEPFFSTKSVASGVGLGLPSAKGFAEQSGGTLRLESSPKGTEVTLYLPHSPTAKS